jgi:hypothetical protein
MVRFRPPSLSIIHFAWGRSPSIYLYPSVPQCAQRYSQVFSHYPTIMESDLSNATVTCPRDGSRWYACDSGSRFVGCCKLDPCKHGCDQDYVGAASFSKDIMGKFPDASCRKGTFFSCTNPSTISSYWGCCKSNPCNDHGCPVRDVEQAYMDRPEQLNFYSNVHEQLPGGYSSNTWENVPLSTSTSHFGQLSGHNKDLILAGLCAALLVVLPIAIAIWISSRNVKTRMSKRRRNNETYVLS